MIQIHRLEGFYRVAIARGYAAAAREFPYPITTPGVHQQVRQLEREMDTSLFERVSRDELRLTAAGERLYAFCAPFFRELPRIVESVQRADYGGTLRIDATPLVARELLPAWVRVVRSKRRDLTVAIEDARAVSFDRLRAGAADLAIDHVVELPSGFARKRIGVARPFLVLPERHPFLRSRRLASLRDQPFVSYPATEPHYALQMEAVRAHIGVVRQAASAGSADAIVALVAAGVGFSIVPWPTPSGPRAKGVVAIEQRRAGGTYPLYAIWVETECPSPLIQTALDAAPT